jgi:flagellar assembly factor FliW
MASVIVESERLGPLDCDESTMLSFPHGLLGFESLREFVVVAADDEGAYSWLQSVSDPHLSFLSIVPSFFFDDYAPEIPDADAAELGITADSHTQLLALVTISDDGVTANLLGPIVVNLRTRTARQIVLSEQKYSVREPLGR